MKCGRKERLSEEGDEDFVCKEFKNPVYNAYN